MIIHVKLVSIEFEVISVSTCSTAVMSFLHSRAGIYSPVFTAHDAQRIYARRPTSMASRLNIYSLVVV